MKRQIVFAGNPNVGKTTIINYLAEARMTTGNWSGVTTERHEAEYILDGVIYHCVDLPGIYGFNRSSDEERITEEYLFNHTIDCIVNVVDSTCLLNNLYCTLQLRELQIPMILVFNFEEDRIKSGIEIDFQWIERRLSIPVFSLQSFEKKELDALKQLIQKACIKQVCYHPLFENETDRKFIQFINHTSLNLKDGIFQFNQIHQAEALKSRQKAIESFARAVSKEEPLLLIKSKKIDQILFMPFIGHIILFTLFFIAFVFIFYGSGVILSFFNTGFYVLKQGIESMIIHYPEFLKNFLINGLFNSVTVLLSFLPVYSLYNLCFSILLESGLMARVSLIFDYYLRIFHLSGKALISLILGFGCNVPAIASSVALENEVMRKKTALLIPFVSCQGRLPIFMFFIQLFYPEKVGIILFILYGSSIFLILMLSLILDIFVKDKEQLEPDIIELPCYRIPKINFIYHQVLHECCSFIRKAFKSVLWILLLLWFLMNFNISNNLSILEWISRSVSIIFKPLGYGNYWQLIAALFASFTAKEAVVAFLLMCDPALSFLPAENHPVIISYLLTCLTMVPCVMSCAMIKDKYGLYHLIKSLGLMMIIPYLISFFVYHLLLLF